MAKYLDEDGLQYLWSKVQDRIGSLNGGYLNINLSTNQGGGVTTTVKVTVDGSLTEYSYNNEPLTIQIKGDSNYTVEFGNIDSYSTPQSVSGVSEAGTTINIDGVYNACKLKFTFSPTSGTATVSYNGITKTMKNNNTLLVPYDVNVTVVPSSIDGYLAANTITFVPSTTSKTISISYQQAGYGMYLVDLDKKLYSLDTVLPKSNIMGFAVITDTVSRIMAIDGSDLAFGPQGEEFDVTDCGNVSAFENPRYEVWTPSGYFESGESGLYCGKANTTAIRKKLSGKTHTSYYGETINGAPAADYCYSFSKGVKGQGQWYLGSAAEYSLFFDDNYDALIQCINLNGLKLNFYSSSSSSSLKDFWSSTMQNTDNAGSSIVEYGWMAYCWTSNYEDYYSGECWGTYDNAIPCRVYPMCDL